MFRDLIQSFLKMKKNILLAVLIFAFVINVNAQKTEIKVGDTFKIETVENNNYKYIKFPKDNFIIKKGGIVNYSNIIGEQVKVTSIKEKKDGSKIATIMLSSGKRFFNSHKYIDVDIYKAIENKELDTI